ncbi:MULTISPECIES: helix-turn-helix domain-containing protein [Rodentibacter]
MKQQVVEFYFNHNESLTQTHHQFGFASKSVRQWIAQFHHAGLNGLRV